MSERCNVAQTSKSAVSRVSKPAGWTNLPALPEASTRCRFGNRRHSRFGNLRYKWKLGALEVAQTSKSAVSRVSKPAGWTNLPALPRLRRAADLEIGDTAGLETCATSGRRMLGGSADFQVCCIAGFQTRWLDEPSGAPEASTRCRFGNRRYGRFGNLRYKWKLGAPGVAQTSKSAVSRVSKPACQTNLPALPEA